VVKKHDRNILISVQLSLPWDIW